MFVNYMNNRKTFHKALIDCPATLKITFNDVFMGDSFCQRKSVYSQYEIINRRWKALMKSVIYDTIKFYFICGVIYLKFWLFRNLRYVIKYQIKILID